MAFLPSLGLAQNATNVMEDNLPLITAKDLDTQSLLKSLLWDQSGTVRTDLGYQDNVLSSPTNTMGSSYWGAGLDYSLTRLPLDGWGVNITVTGDSIRYMQNVPTSGEDFWVGSESLKYMDGNWEYGFEATENYVDQEEFALVQNGLNVVDVRGALLTGKPYIRRNFGTNVWLQADFSGGRNWMADPIGDQWEFGPKCSLGWNPTSTSTLILDEEVLREYNQQILVFNGDGSVNPGQMLATWQSTSQLQWQQAWDSRRRLFTDIRLEFIDSQDNGGGYFNFMEYRVAGRIRYDVKPWQVVGNLWTEWQEFPVQGVNVTSGPHLHVMTWHLDLRAERRITHWLALYAEYSYERAVSNTLTDEYGMSNVTAGASWDF